MTAAQLKSQNSDYTIPDDGAAFVRGLIDADRCERLVEAIAWCRKNPGPNFGTLSKPGQPVVESDLFRWRDVPAIRELVLDGPLPKLACAAFGTDRAILLEDQWFYSEAGSGTPSPWHQDQPYHPLEPWFLTIWIPVRPVPGPVGIRAALGSHVGEIYAPVEFSAGKSTLEAGQAVLRQVPDIDANPVYHRVVAPDAQPGDAVVLDSRTLHAAGGKCLDTFQRISIRYAHPDTLFRERPWPVAKFWREHDIETKYGQRLESPAFPMIIP